MAEDNTPNNLLQMQFEMQTIEHLGISMYSKLPSVIAEIVANAYDADATKVDIQLIQDGVKEIIISDNGSGMDLPGLNDKYLLIGRNRRVADGTDKTPKFNRPVIGKKGIGKLSIFGIAEEVIVTTIQNGNKVSFKMDLDKIKSSEKVYYPEVIDSGSSTAESDGTIIHLKRLKRKSSFSTHDLAVDLSKRFLIFDDNFAVTIKLNNEMFGGEKVTNELKFEKIDRELMWKFPNSELGSNYENKDKVIGEIIASKQPLPADMHGIYLISRGKLVHPNDFYGVKAQDYAHAYITGWLNVDFIDEYNEDLISTNRESLNWENEVTEKLREYIQEIINYVSKDRKKQRQAKVKDEVKKNIGYDIDAAVNSLPKHEAKQARKIIGNILTSDELGSEKAATLIDDTIGSFRFQSFKELAAEISEVDDADQPKLIELLKEWKIIEAKELYKISLARVETIQKFAKLVDENAKEVPTLHNFLKEFSWILDPRISKFDDEVRYSELLKQQFTETDTLEEDKRIDFLCVDFAENIFIIELKRPKVKASQKVINQALEYKTFIEKNCQDTSTPKKVSVFIVCGGVAQEPVAQNIIDSLSNDGKVYVKSYNILLQQALRYHKEIIDKHKEFEPATNNPSNP